MWLVRPIRSLLCALALLFVAGLQSSAQNPSERSGFTPPGSSIGERSLAPQYAKAGCGWRWIGSLDADGALVVHYPEPLGRQYNPVTIAQVALGCYHNYMVTRRPEFRALYLDQIKWLKSNVVWDAPELAAYEYHFPWSYGLKPGWRSGLAQGQAISALIRYYYDTADASVLTVIRGLKNLMLLSVEQGGTAAVTPEGGLWLEEFTSKKPSYVLNGFISAIFGLYEFTKLFPDDVPAQRDFERALNSLKASLHEYDAGDWTYLDRMTTPKPKADDGYALGYLSQLHSLYEITGDLLFLHIGLRWASFFHDVNFQSSGNMREDEKGGVFLKADTKPILPANVLKDNIVVLNATPAIEGFGIDQLFDSDFNTYYGPSVFGDTEIHLKLLHPAVVNVLTVSLYNVEIYPRDIHIFVKEQGHADFIEVVHTRASNRRYLSYYFESRTVEEVRLVADEFQGQQRLVIGELALGKVSEIPVGIGDFGSFRTGAVAMMSESFKIHLEGPEESKGQIIVICRHAHNLADLDYAPWEWNYLDPFSPIEQPTQDRFYQFKVLATKEAAQRGWHAFMVKQGENVLVQREATALELSRRAFGGEPVRVAFDAEVCARQDLGNIECGVMYEARYDQHVNCWTVTGPGKISQEVVTASACNADPRPGSISIWGVIRDFDDDGNLRHRADKVGQVELSGQPH